MVRTSTTYPLRIDDPGIGNGRLGRTFCPGEKGESVLRPVWKRDLDLDLDAVRRWGANTVFSPIKIHEFEMLSVKKTCLKQMAE